MKLNKLKIAICCFVSVFFIETKALYLDTCQLSYNEDPIVYMLDSLSNVKYLETDEFRFLDKNKQGSFSLDSVPRFSDSIYNSRISILDKKSPFDLIYNSAVKGYIDLYAVRKRGLVSKVIALSKLYFPLFEETLDRYNLPLEFKYLAIIESALNTRAKSRVGATGLWQFMYPTGKMYDLNVSSYYDDRSDPYKSTVAACKYFKFLYGLFGDWQMVLAAYNGGPGVVNKAIKRSGGKRTYWEIRPYLPKETQGYVPAFIAVNYVMNHLEEHRFSVSVPKKLFHQVDTVSINYEVTFDQLSTVLNVSMDELMFLNPQYKRNVIPAPDNNSKHYTLTLPAEKISVFLANQSTIYNYVKTDSISKSNYLATVEVLKVHYVKKGEKLSTIAKKYNCSVEDIKIWNKLRSSTVAKGKKLNIYVQETAVNRQVTSKTIVDTTAVRTTDSTSFNEVKAASDTALKEIKPLNNTTVKYKYYTVQQGDTLWNIAKNHGVSMDEIARLNNISKKKALLPGRKIKIGTVG